MNYIHTNSYIDTSDHVAVEIKISIVEHEIWRREDRYRDGNLVITTVKHVPFEPFVLIEETEHGQMGGSWRNITITETDDEYLGESISAISDEDDYYDELISKRDEIIEIGREITF